MTLASISTTAIALTIMGVAGLVGWQVFAVLDGAPRRMEIHAFFRTGLPRTEALEVVRQVEQLPGVIRVHLVTREQAWTEFRKSHLHRDVLEGFKENPLPDKLHVVAQSPELTLQVADRIRQMPGIDAVNEGKQVLSQLLRLMYIARTVGLILGGVMLIGTAVLVSNAIRMTLYARRRDIRVMQLVGATNGFIRLPFLMEGLVEGTLGGALACGALLAAFQYYSSTLLPRVPLLNQFDMALELPLLCGALLAAGGCIGLLGSLVSLRRFLQPA